MRPAVQRAFDLVCLVLLAPLLAIPALLVAIVVFLDSQGSVLYRASRVGYRGTPFLMLKFRTMRSGSTGRPVTAGTDLRITPVGRFLRKTRLDELPQLWNVLRGEMRLVGPRPEDRRFVSLYRREYDEILSVVPGITGSTQLEFAFAEADLLDERDDPVRYYEHRVLPRKVALDLTYARSRSLWVDAGIVLSTLTLPLRLAAVRLTSLIRTRRRDAAYLLGLIAALALLSAFVIASGPAR